MPIANPYRRRRLLGILSLLAYLWGGAGLAAGAVADLMRAAGAAPVAGPCGCAEGADCCGAACCKPVDDIPDCCRPESAALAGSCCDVEEAPAPPASVALALVARCTCGHRDHSSAFFHALDAHVPAVAAAGYCRPPSAPFGCALSGSASVWRPEPRDRVPKPPCRQA